MTAIFFCTSAGRRAGRAGSLDDGHILWCALSVLPHASRDTLTRAPLEHEHAHGLAHASRIVLNRSASPSAGRDGVDRHAGAPLHGVVCRTSTQSLAPSACAPLGGVKARPPLLAKGEPAMTV